MINPFRYTYRITEHSYSKETLYEVEYGNFLFRENLCRDGELRDETGCLVYDNYSFSSLDAAKKAIEDHLTAKVTADLKKRLNQPTSKVIQYV